jgi:putative peptide zinc metalloprotease protein
MLFEITVAAIAVLVAFLTDNDSLRYFACAVAVTGTFSTIAFNANPLVRFDGYFILADLLQKSNLWNDGQQASKELLRRLFNPFRRSSTPLSLGLAAYGLGCTIYRFGMLLGLAITALLVWQEYGLLLIAWGCSAWFVLPWWKARKAAQLEQLNRPEPKPKKSLLARWTPVALGAAICASLFLPAPMQLSVPGVVALRDPAVLRIESDGYLATVFVKECEFVEANTMIARFENPQLTQMVASKRVEVAGSTELISAMRARGELAELQAEQAKLESLHDQLAQLEHRLAQLEVRAPTAGTIMSSDLEDQVGKYFTAGAPLALLANPGQLEIKLSASQQEHAKLRACAEQEIRVHNSRSGSISCVVDKIDWRGSDQLDEPVLAATYGGPITVATGANQNAETIKLTAPRFDVRLRIVSPADQGLVPGQIAWARLPDASTRILDLISHWIGKKWESAKQLNKSV